MAVTSLKNKIKRGNLLVGNDVYYFDSIATVTVGAGGSANVEFTSIPGTYKHLQIRCIARDAGTSGTLNVQFNGDTGSNYARHVIYGDGAGAYAAASTGTACRFGYIAPSTYTASVFGSAVVDILDYANTNKYKVLRSISGVDNNGSGEMDFRSGGWFKAGSGVTSDAITSIKIYSDGGSNIAEYSHFALYGVK